MIGGLVMIFNLLYFTSLLSLCVQAGDGRLKLGLQQLLKLGEFLCLCPQLVGKGALTAKFSTTAVPSTPCLRESHSLFRSSYFSSGLLVRLIKVYGTDDTGFGGPGRRSSLLFPQFLRLLCDLALRVATVNEPLLQKFVSSAQVRSVGISS